MLIWLVELSDKIQVFNLFRYITFRAGAAMFTSALIVFLFGPAIINSLRVRQGKGQPIRADGPQTHFKKAGTPTMGGLMILSASSGRACCGPTSSASMSGWCCWWRSASARSASTTTT